MVKTLIRIYHGNNLHGKYHRMASRLIKELLSQFELKNALNLPERTILKIQWYMASALWTCEFLNEMHGLKSTPKQQRMYLLSGSMMAISDILVDDLESDMERVNALKCPDVNFLPESDLELVYLKFYFEFFDEIDSNKLNNCKAYYERSYQAQVDSKAQFDPSLSIQEINRLCVDKCGIGMLYLRSMIDAPVSSDEKSALYELGAYIQFCNDTQDIYKDTKKGIRTMANSRAGLKELIHDLDGQKCRTFSMIKKSGFCRARQHQLLFTFNVMGLGIIAKIRRLNEVCEGNYSLDKLVLLSKQNTRISVFNFSSFRFLFPKIIDFDFDTADRRFTYDWDFL